MTRDLMLWDLGVSTCYAGTVTSVATGFRTGAIHQISCSVISTPTHFIEECTRTGSMPFFEEVFVECSSYFYDMMGPSSRLLKGGIGAWRCHFG